MSVISFEKPMNNIKSFFFSISVGYGPRSLDLRRGATIIFNYEAGHSARILVN